MTATPHSQLPEHCATCGADWPKGRFYALCPSCNAGVPCHADTTDEIAPDPACGGSRKRMREVPQ